MTKRIIALLALVALVAIGYILTRSGPANTGLKQVSLRLQWLDQAQFAGFYVAEAKGFYKEHGLDVKIHPGGPDFNSMTLVASGSDTFGIWTGDQLVLGKSKGLPLVPIGAIFDQSLVAFMVKANSGITSPKDFEGRNVGINYGYDSETLYLHLLKKFGVDRSKVKETLVQFDLGLFFNGNIDVWPSYVVNQPIVAQQKGVALGELITPKKFGIKYYSDVLFVRSDYLEANKSIVSDFLKASIEGWKFALENRDVAADIVMARNSALDRDQQRKMLDVIAEYLNVKSDKPFSLDRTTWESIETILTDQGLLKQQVPIADLIQGNDIPR